MGRRRHRERVREDSFGNVTVQYTDINGITTPKTYGCFPFLVHNEEMDDAVGFKKSDFNPCFHDHYINTGKPIDVLTVEINPGQYEHYTCNAGGVHVQDVLGALRNIDFGIVDWLDDFGASAEDHFKTTVQDQNSILNLILETIEVLDGNLRIVKRLSVKMSKALDIFWRMIRKTGDHWLAWNFAIKPTIRDVYSLVTSMQTAQKRLKFLREWNHRDIKVHYRELPRPFSGTIVPEVAWFTHVPGGDPLIPPPLNLRAEITYDCDIALSAWAWIRFDIPDYLLDDWTTAIGMILLTQQGVYNPVKVIWEAVPFSWLIDWFTGKRAQLAKEAASLSPFPDATILGVGHTIRIQKMTGSVNLYLDNPSGTVKYVVGDYFYKRFDRRPGLPSGDSAFRPIIPNAWQTSILVALGSKPAVKRRR